jgi:DNA oxidative demethylase
MPRRYPEGLGVEFVGGNFVVKKGQSSLPFDQRVDPSPSGPVEVLPGAWLVSGWIDSATQQQLIDGWHIWRTGPGKAERLRMAFGRYMSVETTCLGWQWVPYRYQTNNTAGVPVDPLPTWLGELAKKAVNETMGLEAGGAYLPDVALVNFYDSVAKMGLHQDRDERSDDPVVSLSVGDSCRFRFGNNENKRGPFTDIDLHSGDLLVFGGPARFAYHGVIRTFPNPQQSSNLTGLETGRLNITVRNTGIAKGAARTFQV